MLKLIVLFLLVITIATSATATLDVPDQEWLTSAEGKFDVHRDNRAGRVTVFPSGKRDVPVLDVMLDGFHAAYSRVIVTDAPVVIHVRGYVSDIRDAGITVYYPSGAVMRIPVKSVVDTLHPLTRRLAGLDYVPDPYWFETVTNVSAGRVALRTAEGSKTVDLCSGAVSAATPEPSPATK